MSKVKNKKYIVVLGGVISGGGKGVIAASLGTCLQSRGITVSLQKFDMYLNVDAGLLNPGRHGEVFVTKDGGETDLDIGHYERFLDRRLSRQSSVMAGQVFSEVIAKERAGGFKGQDVQIIPHITDFIQDKIVDLNPSDQVSIIELGGTVGDYESLAFVEAVRQLPAKVGQDSVFYIYVVYLPYIPVTGETKTKPAQNALRDLRGVGIVPNLIIARSQNPIDSGTRQKLSLFGGRPLASVINIPDLKTVYGAPLLLEEQQVGQQVAGWLGSRRRPDLKKWQQIEKQALGNFSKVVKIGLVAKYLANKDTYFSVIEALKVAAWSQRVKLEIVWLDAEKLGRLKPASLARALEPFAGLLVPGGFGQRGIKGMIATADLALKNNQPYFGICLGMQVGVIAQARQAGLSRANSAEFVKPGQKDQLVIDYLPGQKQQKQTGSTMRLGDYPCRLRPKTLAAAIYREKIIYRRHRHRLEFNNDYKKELQAAGLVVSGVCPTNKLVEIVESRQSDFFIGCQFHPEFDSRPNRPEALFVAFIQAAKSRT